MVKMNSYYDDVLEARLECSHSCNGLRTEDSGAMKFQETIGDTFFQSFHNFYLENPGWYQILFMDDQERFISSLGHQELFRELKGKGIVPGVSWTKKCENPFVVSLREGRPIYQMGPQKDCSLFRPFSIFTFPLHSQGDSMGLVGVLSPSKPLLESLFPKLQELVKKTEQELNYFSSTDLLTGNDSLEKYLASLVHEIKNPLMLIRGNAQLGTMLTSEGEKDKKFAKILQEVDSLLTTVDNMVLMYKKHQVEFSTNNLHLLLEDVLGVIDAGARLKKLIVKKQFTAGQFTFDFHYNLMRQAFLNLLSNGIQVLDPGGTLSIITANPHPGTIQIIIQDNGPGIEESELSRVFLPFYSTREEGTGLGLAIVKKIMVQDHGGSIKVDSKPGVGTTFTITFSLEEN